MVLISGNSLHSCHVTVDVFSYSVHLTTEQTPSADEDHMIGLKAPEEKKWTFS